MATAALAQGRVRLDEPTRLSTDVSADAVYFSKRSVKNGTKILNFGRRSFGTVWQVVGITTYPAGKYGKAEHESPFVRSLDDEIHLHCIETREWKTVRFRYLSESARWRLGDQEPL